MLATSHVWPDAQQVVPQTCPEQHNPFWQLCPDAQQLMLPHTVVPGAQQPPAGRGVPLQQMLPAQTAPAWQQTPPHTTPDAQQMPPTHAVPEEQHVVPHTCWPAWQQPPLGRAPPAGQQVDETGSHCVPTGQQLPPHANSAPLRQQRPPLQNSLV